MRWHWPGLLALGAWAGCGWPVSPVNAPAHSSPPLPAGETSLLVLPDDGGQTIVTALAGARRRAWVEMYLLTDGDALDALVAARRAGADVRVLLEPDPYGSSPDNQSAYLALQQAGIDVRWFAVPDGLVHIKLLLLDDAAWVLTPNLTHAGLTGNREYAVVDRAAADVARAETIFQDDAAGRPLEDDGGATRVVVSPLDARPRLTAAIDAARMSLRLEIEELSDPDLVARLSAGQARGVTISVLVPDTDRSASTDAAAAALRSAGVPVRALPSPTLHAKAMVVDDRVAYVGSINFTSASLDDNRELGLLLTDAPLVSRVGATLDSDWAHGVPL